MVPTVEAGQMVVLGLIRTIKGRNDALRHERREVYPDSR